MVVGKRGRLVRKGKHQDDAVPAAVKNYINKTLLMKPLSAERKWYQIGCANISLGCGQLYLVNPFYLLSQGSTQDSRIGLNVSNVHLLLDVQYTHFGCSSIGTGKYSSSNFRVIVFTNPAKWRQTVYNVPELNTAGTGTVIPTSDIFLDSGVDRMSHSFINKDVNSLIDDSGQRIVKSASAPIGAAWSATGFQDHYKKTVRIGDLRWEYNTNSFLRDVQIYIGIVADTQGYAAIAPSTGDNLGAFGINFLVTFQDS